MREISPSRPAPTTSHGMFSLVGLTALVRSVTETFKNRRQQAGITFAPRNPSAASKRADVMAYKAKPVEILTVVDFADLDDGVPVALVNAYLRQMIAQREEYAARKSARDRSNVLPFPDVLNRLHRRETKEQGEADMAVLSVDQNCATSCRKAAAEILEEIQPKLDLAMCLQRRAEELEIIAG